MKAVMPTSFSGRILLIISFATSAGVYLLRRALNDMVIDKGTGMLCLPVVCILGVPAILFFINTIIYTFKPGGHPIPMMVLILGMVLAFGLPIPPTYEIRLFQSHRTDYERLVNLARDHRLDHSQRCDLERTYELSEEYRRLSSECLLVDYQPFFSVQFAPRVYVEQIVYIEDPTRIEEIMGCRDSDTGDHKKQLDKNWFYCSMNP